MSTQVKYEILAVYLRALKVAKKRQHLLSKKWITFSHFSNSGAGHNKTAQWATWRSLSLELSDI